MTFEQIEATGRLKRKELGFDNQSWMIDPPLELQATVNTEWFRQDDIITVDNLNDNAGKPDTIREVRYGLWHDIAFFQLPQH